MKRLLCLIVITAMLVMIPLTGLTVSYASAATSGTVINAETEMIMSGEEHWDVRVEAKQSIYGYDTIQGACSHKGYAYMALYNRNVERIRIAKVNLRTMTVEKVSDPLRTVAHGNTLTYNTRTNRIIVVCGQNAKKRIAIFNPKTMKMTGTRTIRISTKKLKQKFTGINGFAYNAAKNVYVLKVRDKSGKIVILDKKFRVKRVVRPQGVRQDLLAQGLYSEGNFMYDIQSFRGNNLYNLVTVRSLYTGKVVRRIKFPCTDDAEDGRLFELENIFHDGKNWYASYYRATVKENGDLNRENYLFLIKNMPFK